MKTALKLAFAVICMATRAFSAGPGTFQTFPTYPTPGFGPSAIALADLNHDGSLDMVAVDIQIEIFLNNGDGTFKPVVSYSAGAEPRAVAVGDFNHDGKLDLAVANSTSTQASKAVPGDHPDTCVNGCVMILLGNGDGTFQPGGTYAADAGAYSIAAADFNGDGKLDLVTSNSQGNDISVLLGNGDGTFKPAVNYAVTATPGFLVVADFNGDHHPDIAVGNDSTTGGVQVFLGKGDGTFQPAVTYSTGASYSFAIAAADFNGDGRIDMAVTAFNLTLNTSGIAILLGNGDGTFQSPSTIPLGPWGAGASSLASGDANSDGKSDLIASTTGGFTISLGEGDGTFELPVSYSGLDQASRLAVGDLNGDNKLDIAATNEFPSTDFSGGVSVILGFGDGAFPGPRLYNLGTGGTFSTTYSQAVVAADFNKDGFVDVANSVNLLLGNGDGTFATGASYTSGDSIAGLAADFNHDGNLDLAWVNYIPKGTVYVLSGNGDGNFKKAINNKAHKDPNSIVTADFNRDGNLDLVTTNWNSSDISVLLGNGDGTFKPAVNHLIGSLSSATNILATADFNGDGNPDLAIVNNGGIGISLGNGDGTFQPQVMYGAGEYSVAVADINHDGQLDLVATGTASTGGVEVLLGNGDGTFQPPIPSSGGQLVLATLADFNGDGLLDVVTVALYPYPSSPIAVQFGNSDGTFQAPVYYYAGNQPIRATAADFNGDGAPDLAIGSLSGFTISLNTGGTFLATSNAPNPSTLQENVTFTTTVAASVKGQPVPTGKVTFMDGITTLGSATLSNGQAIFTTSFSTSGQHQITPIFSGDSNFNPHTGTAVTQTVQAPTVNISPTQLNFGNQKVGTRSAPMSAKLTNRGAGTLLLSSIAASSSEYSVANNCGSSLGQNKSCTLTVTFTPSKTGTRTGTITVTDNATNSPQKLFLTGNGT
jgi:hypothetical protein